MGPEVIIVPAIFIGIPWTLGWIFKANLSHQRFMKVLQLKADMSARLLDRAGSDPAALELLKSEAHQQLFNVTVDEAPAAYSRMLTALQLAFMLLSGGAACLWFSAHTGANYRDLEIFQFLGAVGIALGIGSLLSAAAALIVGRLWKSLHAAS